MKTLYARVAFTTFWTKFSRRQIDDIFPFFLLGENRIRHFVQTVFIGDNLHEMSSPVFWEK